MPLIEDPISCVASLHNRSYLDSCRGSPGRTTMTTTATTATTNVLMTAAVPTTLVVDQFTHLHQLSNLQRHRLQNQQSQSNVAMLEEKLNPTLQPSALAATTTSSLSLSSHEMSTLPSEQLLPQSALSVTSLPLVNPEGTNLNRNESVVGQHRSRPIPPPMSDILRTQLEELKHLSQPLGSHLLSKNEQLLCRRFNLPPTSYMSLKTYLLSGSPVVMGNLSPLESIVRKYFVKIGWLSH